MLNSAKNSQHIDEEELHQERRKSSDRRVSSKSIRFPFIDDNHKLVMKDRRSEDRRTSELKLKNNPLKIVNKLFKK